MERIYAMASRNLSASSRMPLGLPPSRTASPRAGHDAKEDFLQGEEFRRMPG
jgi:hypothetical protein